MNNTPTPKTDAIPWIPNPIFYNSDLDLVRYVRIKEVRQLERELTAVTEQRDGLRSAVDYASDQLTRVTEQRDRLAEALRKAISWGDSASHHILYRQNINWTYLNEAREALQSLNPNDQVEASLPIANPDKSTKQ